MGDTVKLELQAVKHREVSAYLRKRIWLLLCLLPIVAVWLYMAIEVPIMNFGKSWASVWRSQSGNKVGLHCRCNWVDSDWQQFLEFDLDTGQMNTVSPLVALPVPGTEITEEFTRDGQLFKRWRVAITNPETGQPTRHSEFEFPAELYPKIIGNRFIIGASETGTRVLDLEAAELKSSFYAEPSFDANSWPMSIGDTRRFVRAKAVLTSANNRLPSVWIELFEIGEDGIPHLINRWQALCESGGGWHYAEVDHNLVSLHPTNGTFEFRSHVDGSLIAAHPLPSDFNPATEIWYTRVDRLSVGTRTFSFRTKRWLISPEGNYRTFEDSPGSGLRLWSDTTDEAKQCELVVTDVASEEQVSKFKFSDPITRVVFMDDEHFAFVTSRWGYTLGLVNARTGELMKVWRPYWWVFPVLLLSVSAYMLWCVAWLKSAGATWRWAWADVAWVSAIPIVILAVRVKCVGEAQDLSREPHAIVEGFILALFFLSSLSLCGPRGRLVHRVLPMMLSLAAVSSVLAFVFANKTAAASNLLLLNLLLASACLIASLGLSFLGYHLVQQKTNSQSPIGKTTLLEIFVLVAASAVMFAPMRSMIPNFSNLYAVLTQWIYLAFVVIAPASAWMLASSTNRYVYGLGKWLAIIAFAFLQLYIYYFFIEAQWLFLTYSPLDQVLILVPSAFVATFVLSIAFCAMNEEPATNRENEAPAERDFPVDRPKLSSKTYISREKMPGFPGKLRVARSRWLVHSRKVVPPSHARQSLVLPLCSGDGKTLTAVR